MAAGEGGTAGLYSLFLFRLLTFSMSVRATSRYCMDIIYRTTRIYEGEIHTRYGDLRDFIIGYINIFPINTDFI